MGFWNFVKDSFMEGWNEGYNNYENAYEKSSKDDVYLKFLEGAWGTIRNHAIPSIRDFRQDDLKKLIHGLKGVSERFGDDNLFENFVNESSSILDVMETIGSTALNHLPAIPITNNPFWHNPTNKLCDENVVLMFEAYFAINYFLTSFLCMAVPPGLCIENAFALGKNRGVQVHRLQERYQALHNEACYSQLNFFFRDACACCLNHPDSLDTIVLKRNQMEANLKRYFDLRISD